MQKKVLLKLLFSIGLGLALAGCGEPQPRVTDGSEAYVKREESQTERTDTTDSTEGMLEEQDQPQESEPLFIISSIDAKRKTMTLYNCETDQEKLYGYTGATYIKGKYGDSLTAAQVSPGEIVTVELKEETLTEVQVAAEGFSYDDLSNYTLDRENKTLMVGSEKYFFDDNLLIYHGDSKVSLSEISVQDTICLKGMGNRIYAIQIIAGHGTVVLENTELFQGGYITIGNMVSKKITPQMRIEVAEGSYLLSVANDGYGGSREVTIKANQETKVNLDELKGSGPQFCQIQFKIVPSSGSVFLDGEQVETNKTVEVRYGTHKLTAKKDGYDPWSKTLIVNSKTAQITIELTEENDEDEPISTSDRKSVV